MINISDVLVMKILKKIGEIYLRVIALSICYPSNEINYKNKT